MTSPPGGGKYTFLPRAINGPAKSMEALISPAKVFGSFTVFPAGKSVLMTRLSSPFHSTCDPIDSRSCSMDSTSLMAGTFSSVTVSSVSSVAASMGRTAFLLPDGAMVPDNLLPPCTMNFSIYLPSPDECMGAHLFLQPFSNLSI